MRHLVNEMIEHMSISHQQLARVLEAKRDVAVRMAQIIHELPDKHPEFNGLGGLMENAKIVTKNVVTYLHSIAALQEMMAENLSHIMRELDDNEEE